MTDTRPSIAELEAMVTKWDGVDHTTVTLSDVADDLITAANSIPILTAIARAAQSVIDAHDSDDLHGDAYYKACTDARQQLREALKAVRP